MLFLWVFSFNFKILNFSLNRSFVFFSMILFFSLYNVYIIKVTLFRSMQCLLCSTDNDVTWNIYYKGKREKKPGIKKKKVLISNSKGDKGA